jgi:DNA polymerase III alpha subunit
MAAVLTAEMQNTDKVVTLIEECRRMKIEVKLPDVNVSSFTFTVDDKGDVQKHVLCSYSEILLWHSLFVLHLNCKP